MTELYQVEKYQFDNVSLRDEGENFDVIRYRAGIKMIQELYPEAIANLNQQGTWERKRSVLIRKGMMVHKLIKIWRCE